MERRCEQAIPHPASSVGHLLPWEKAKFVMICPLLGRGCIATSAFTSWRETSERHVLKISK